MKKIIFLVIIIMASSYAFTQNNLNPKKIDGYNFSSTFIDKDYFKNNFIRGYNWASSNSFTKNLDLALSINSYHVGAYYQNQMPSSEFANNISFITPLALATASYKGFYTCTGLGIYLEPSLNVDNTSSFIPNSEADYGSVFGFQSKTGGSNTIVF